MRAVLIGTYEMGRQPFGLASPAAWLRRAGWEVACIDLSRQELDTQAVAAADLIGLYLPMHTATRLALALLPRLRGLARQPGDAMSTCGRPFAATRRRHEHVRASVAGERSPATARPEEGRLQQEVAVPLPGSEAQPQPDWKEGVSSKRWLCHARARIVAFGLYAPMNAALLRAAGVDTVLGPEFEADLAAGASTPTRGGRTARPAGDIGAEGCEIRAAAARPRQTKRRGPGRAGAHGVPGPAERQAGGVAQPRQAPRQSMPGLPQEGAVPLPRLAFVVPDRHGLPPLAQYAHLHLPSGERRIAGYTEASRGCKHSCRHCPIVPIYQGRFRIVPPGVVLADIRQQVAAGAQHITFGDPDFLNGPTHALRIADALHREFPTLSFDATIKVEHLLQHAALLPRLRDAGCALITTAVESFDDAILAKLAKGHTAADFFRALELTRRLGLPLNPTFVSFTPWTTPAGFRAMLAALAAHDLVAQIAPVQFGIRLLIPQGSLMLDLPDAPQWLGAFDPAALSFRWRPLDPSADELCAAVQDTVARATKAQRPRADIFAAVADFVGGVRLPGAAPVRATIPYLDEPWFC